MIYGCSQPRELWFIDFNHVYTCMLYNIPFFVGCFLGAVEEAVSEVMRAANDFGLPAP